MSWGEVGGTGVEVAGEAEAREIGGTEARGAEMWEGAEGIGV